MTHIQNLLAAAVVLGFTALSASAQSFEPGYAHTSNALPLSTGQALSVPAGDVYFTGTALVLSTRTQRRVLLSFPTKVFGSFTIAIDEDRLLFGESSQGGLWVVPLDVGQTPRKLATVPLNYAACVHDGTWAIVSAKTGGFGSKQNDVLAVHLQTGALDPIASLPGASGPVACDGFGNLFYVTASDRFPPPKGSSTVLRFAASRVRGAFGPGVLGLNDAGVVYAGLDSAGAIALDGDQDAFVTDWMNKQILEISGIHTLSPRASTLASYTGASVSPNSLQFRPGAQAGLGVQEFEPFQPGGAGTLIIHESQFGSTSQLRALTPARPTLQATGPRPVPAGAPFDLVVEGGAAGVQGFLALGIGDHYREVLFHRPVEAPVFWSTTLVTPVILSPVSFDARGKASLRLFNPGFPAPLTVTAQAYFETTEAAGSSSPMPLILR